MILKDEQTGELWEEVGEITGNDNPEIKIIRPIVKQEPKKLAMLGYATTRELLAELTARIEVSGELDYSTFYGNPNDSMRENN